MDSKTLFNALVAVALLGCICPCGAIPLSSKQEVGLEGPIDLQAEVVHDRLDLIDGRRHVSPNDASKPAMYLFDKTNIEREKAGKPRFNLYEIIKADGTP